MANILVIHSGLKGITNACLELSKRLELDGHTVYNASATIDREKEIKSNGLKFVSINQIEFEYRNNIGGSYLNLIRIALFQRNKTFEEIYESLNLPAFRYLIQNKKPDLLLIDMELHEYIIFSKHLKIPVILLSQWFLHLKYPGNLPLNSSRTPKSQIQQSLIWRFNFIISIIKVAGKSIKTLGLNRRKFIRYLSRKLNYSLSNLESFQFPLPFIHKQLPILSMTHPELEFKTPSIDQFNYAYPMVYENRIEQENSKFDDLFKDLLKNKEAGNKKLIVVTQTSMKGKTSDSLRTILDVLSDLEDCISIVSLGNEFEKYSSKSYPDSIHLFKSIPQLKVFKHSDLSINHGGIHTINECIHFKLPMLILSGNRFDQNGCAARVAAYGCGIAHFSSQIDSSQIRDDIEDLLFNSTFKKKLERLYDIYQKAKEEKQFEIFIRNKLKNN